MKLKRFALRGLIVLFVAVALCMFFARTVQTITTPKVQLVQSTSGRFEDKMTFRAQVYFAETEEFTVEEAKDMNITVDKLYVRAGNYVKKGDIIFTATKRPLTRKKSKRFAKITTRRTRTAGAGRAESQTEQGKLPEHHVPAAA